MLALADTLQPVTVVCYRPEACLPSVGTRPSDLMHRPSDSNHRFLPQVLEKVWLILAECTGVNPLCREIDSAAIRVKIDQKRIEA